MSLEPGRQVVWIGDLFVDERAPMALCAPHVARVSVPSGWDINDLRDDAPAFWRDDAIDDIAEQPTRVVARRPKARRRWSSGKMQALPGLFDAPPTEHLIETGSLVDATATDATVIDTSVIDTSVIDTAAANEPKPVEVTPVAVAATPLPELVEDPSKQSLEGLTAMYGPATNDQDAEFESNPEDALIESLLAAKTPLLARAFRNARAS